MSRPTYLNFLNAFDNLMNSNTLRPNEQLLYHTLLMINNRKFWVEWIGCTDAYLTERMGIGKTALNNARNALKQYGMIDFVTSKKRGTSTQYKICDEFCSSETDNKRTTNPTTNVLQTNYKPTANKDKRLKTKDFNNPLTPFEGELGQKIEEWLKYKQERRQEYKPTALKRLFTEIEKQKEVHGEAFVMECIDSSIVNNWQGLFFDKAAGNKKERGNLYSENNEYKNLAELTQNKKEPY